MKNIAKIFVIIMAVALVFGALSMYTFAADDGAYTTVYLTPNAKWAEDNARFAVYCQKGSQDEWVDMYAVVGESNIYSAQIPAEYDQITFCSILTQKSYLFTVQETVYIVFCLGKKISIRIKPHYVLFLLKPGHLPLCKVADFFIKLGSVILK